MIESPIELAQIHMEEPKKPLVIEQELAGGKQNMVKNIVPIVVENHLVHPEDVMQDQEQLKDAVSGKLTINDGRIGDESFEFLDHQQGVGGQIIEKTIVSEHAAIETFVEQMPQYPGGDEKLAQFLVEHLVYATAAFNAGVEGNVILKFVVNEDGSVTQVRVIRGFGFGSEEQAIKVLDLMPHWIPGMNNGHPVKVWCHLPIHFKLK